MTPAIQALEHQGLRYPVLPSGMTRNHVERLLTRTSRAIGLSANQLSVLLLMISETRPSDWTDPDREPVCYAMQTNIALRLNITERSVRRIESQLVHLGLVRKDVGLSGRRYCVVRPDGSSFRQGIVFSPLIQQVPHLQTIESQLNAQIAERRELKLKISAARRAVATHLEALSGARDASSSQIARIRHLSDHVSTIPNRFPASMPLAELRTYFEKISEVLVTLDKLVLGISEESGHPDTRVRPIQEPNQEKTVSSTGESAAFVPAIDNSTGAPCSESCVESKERRRAGPNTPGGLNWLTPSKLFELCSHDMQLRIMMSQGDRRYTLPSDFLNASIDSLQRLGISAECYQTAVETMGPETTTLCIVIIDRNRFHPVTPVRRPGGVLQAMARRHKCGDLNLNASLLALSRRPNDW